MFGSQLVEDPQGGVILIGGSSQEQPFSDVLYKLSHAGYGAKWIELEQKLSVGSRYHIAILIPDNLVNCTAANN